MDTQHAIVVGRENIESGSFVVLAHEKSMEMGNNLSEKGTSNAENNALHKLFKSISAHMPNVDEVHVTGTGTAQEQFISFLGQTPQFKNAVATESTSNKMSDENLVEYMTDKFN